MSSKYNPYKDYPENFIYVLYSDYHKKMLYSSKSIDKIFNRYYPFSKSYFPPIGTANIILTKRDEDYVERKENYTKNERYRMYRGLGDTQIFAVELF